MNKSGRGGGGGGSLFEFRNVYIASDPGRIPESQFAEAAKLRLRTMSSKDMREGICRQFIHKVDFG